MEIGIMCNFAHQHIGGSEIVIKHISEILVGDYGHELNVYSFSCDSHFREQGVNYYPCLKGDRFVSQIGRNDHLMVYSDSFWEFDTLVRNIDKIDCRVSVVLVGAYYMQSHPEIFRLLKQNIDRFNLITHSSTTIDYKWCIDNGLPVRVIPNGVALEEFGNNSINFREKYNIKDKYMFLNVSSFFFGKGQDMLADIGGKIKGDYVIVQISSSADYPYEKRFLKRCRDRCKNINIRFLRDIPREDVVAAFKNSDIFVFTSKKEVSPLVILESQAAGLPWVSMDVGDIRERKGGKVINNNNEDGNGYKIINNKIISSYMVKIADILELKDLNNQLVLAGQEDIKNLDWKKIVPLYDRIFNL